MGQWANGPAIGRGVMNDQQEHMAAGIQPEQPCVHRDLLCDVDAGFHGLRDTLGEEAFVNIFRSKPDECICLRQNALECTVIRIFKDRSETFVPGNDVLDC